MKEYNEPINLNDYEPNAEILGLVPRGEAILHQIFPLEQDNGTLVLAIDQEDGMNEDFVGPDLEFFFTSFFCKIYSCPNWPSW